MSGSDEMSLAEWTRALRVLLRAFELSVNRARRLDSDVAANRTDSEWREAFEEWRGP